ncbi:MAG: response regulator [Acidimicrobiales bacterium]
MQQSLVGPNARPTSPAGSSKSLQVWMVDDDPNDLLFLELAITDAGLDAEVTYLDDGTKLIDKLHAADADRFPAIVVLDLMMPGINGHEVLELLQNDSALWSLPVVVFSHSSRPTDKVKGFDRGARWFRTKPSDFDEMVRFAESLPSMAQAGAEQAGLVSDDTAEALGLDEDTVAQLETALRTVRWHGTDDLLG